MELKTGHIGLNVGDLERSRAFYQKALGFEVMGGQETGERRYAFLGTGGKLLLTLWQQSEGRFQSRAPGLHHLSFQVESAEELRQAEQRLKELDVHFHYEGVVPHREGASSGGVFFEDPDGIRLEIYSPEGVEGHAPVEGAPSCGFF